MKSTPRKNQKMVVVSRAHRIWAALALLALFICGLMVGMTLRPVYVMKKDVANPAPVVAVDVETPVCVQIEDMLTKNLWTESDFDAMVANVTVYESLAQHGCAENQAKWNEMMQRTKTIGNALYGPMFLDRIGVTIDTYDPQDECKEVERIVIDTNIKNCESSMVYEKVACYLNNATVYSDLSQKGCQTNSQKYKNLATHQIEIATALEDELNEHDTEIVIDAYKKMEMEAEAQKFLDKIKRLTNPAIDFILQMEAIINEESHK